MASVIREGGNNPIKVKTWQGSLKIALLEKMYDQGRRGVHEDDFYYSLGDRSVFAEQYGHNLSKQDIRDALKEMLTDGWAEVSEEHAKRFRLTQKGYDLVPEHFFP